MSTATRVQWRARGRAGIETTLGTYAMHAHPAFARFGYSPGRPAALVALPAAVADPAPAPAMSAAEVDVRRRWSAARMAIVEGVGVTDDELEALEAQLLRLSHHGATRPLRAAVRPQPARSPSGSSIGGSGRGASGSATRRASTTARWCSATCEVGAHTWVGPYTLLDGSGGRARASASYCSISAGVHIYTHDTVRRSAVDGCRGRATAGAVVDRRRLPPRGARASWLPGVTIGDRCVIGANSFVKGDVPSRAIVVGSPRGRWAWSWATARRSVRIGPDAVAALGARGPV